MGVYSACKALVVGVGRYDAPQYDLSYARSDAEAMAELLGSEFGFDQVWTLYDNDATRQNLIRFFEQDLQRTEEDDGLLIFFAGHGITVTSAIGDDRGFLVPHDGDPKQPYANLSLTTIRDDYMPMIPAKHVFLIVDSCYGGLALRDVATVERPKSIDDAVLSELTRRDRKVRQVLAAGTKDQRVLDGGLFGHSVFTGRLIEALREADPYITADHVGVHVRERVARDSLDRKHRQTPQFGYLSGGEGSFVFQVRRRSRTHGNRKLHSLGRKEEFAEEYQMVGNCDSCGKPVSEEWRLCPYCGQSVAKTEDSSESMGVCGHCKGTGKCDCFKCRFEFAANNLYGDDCYDSHIPTREMGRKRADSWASTHRETVECARCDGSGRE